METSHAAPVSFRQLYDRLRAVAIDVRVERVADRHVIVLADETSERVIRYPVARSFDRAASVIVASARLRELLAASAAPPHRDHPHRAPGDVVVCGRWPEFAALWPLDGRPAGDTPR